MSRKESDDQKNDHNAPENISLLDYSTCYSDHTDKFHEVSNCNYYNIISHANIDIILENVKNITNFKIKILQTNVTINIIDRF